MEYFSYDLEYVDELLKIPHEKTRLTIEVEGSFGEVVQVLDAARLAIPEVREWEDR